MTEQEIEFCLERFATCKTTDVMNFDYAGTLAYIRRLKSENAELKEKAQKLDKQLKAISDRTAKFPSLEQIEKRFLDWAIPFLKARITGCKEEWFGIEWIAKAIWEFIKNDFENAIAVDETNAALRERLEKAVELPCKVGDKVYAIFPIGDELKILDGAFVGIEEVVSDFKGCMCAIIVRQAKDGHYFNTYWDLGQFNKTWWADKEIAESKLAEVSGGYWE